MKMYQIRVLIASFVIYFGCGDGKRNISLNREEVRLTLNKIVVVNNGENSMTYFKIRIDNPHDKTFFFLDNNLEEHHRENIKPSKTGFYLKNIKNDSLITLGSNNYFSNVINPKSKEFYFFGAVDVRNSFEEKDSSLLRKMLSDYVLEYNGKSLNLDKIKKSKYINDKDYNYFYSKKDGFTPYKDSMAITIPAKTIEIKYLYETPIYKEEWDSL